MFFKKFSLSAILLLLVSQIIYSQNKYYFEVIPNSKPAAQIVADFEGAKNSASAVGDIDGDGDLDIFVMGSYSFSIRTSKLYLNDGYGNYTRLINDSIENLEDGAAEFGDIDGDNDLDLIISGNNSSNQSTTKLYLNNGKGKFTEQTGIPFPNVRDGSLNLFDIDNDDDLDLLITGETSSNNSVARLYTNNGNGVFTISASHNFVNVRLSNAKVVDIDNDNDLDVFITGYNQSFFATARLYKNNGAGTFSYFSNSLTGVHSGGIDFADIDNDNDLDLVLTGNISNFSFDAAIYLNDSIGNFTRVSNTPFIPVEKSSAAFLDVDNDNDMDVIIAGYENTAQRSTKLYLNDSLGGFTYDTSNYLSPIESGSIQLADFDGDNDQDVFLTGTGLNNLGVARIYTSNNAGVLSPINGTQFNPMQVGTSDLVDLDNDADLDMIVTGYHNQLNEQTYVYMNDSNGVYTELLHHGIEDIRESSLDFSDIDNDSDIDVIVCGRNATSQKITKLYLNNGNGIFTQSASNFDGIDNGVVKFVDFDNDNDEDIFIAGMNNSNQRIAKFYINNGSGSYTVSSISNISAFNIGDAEFFDMDNDNDLDLIISGFKTGGAITELYRNNGGSFSLIVSTPFRALRLSSIAIGDIDNDNDEDVLLIGQVNTSVKFADLYTNNGSGVFTRVSTNPFTAVSGGDAEFADFDDDSDLDIIISGAVNTSKNISELYINDGLGNYSLNNNKPLIGVYQSSISIGDVDNDQDLDMIISGVDTTMKNYATLYRNIYCNDYQFDTAIACVSYTWFNNQVYTNSTQLARDTVPNQFGCDSIIRLNLIVNYEDTIHDTVTACNSYTWIDSIMYTSSNDSAFIVLTNSKGCDSTVYLDLTINYSDTIIDTIRACNSFTWIDNNTYTWSNDTARVLLTNTYGCDSILILDLTIDSTNTMVSQNRDTLTAHRSNAIYKWLDCNNNMSIIIGADSQTFVPGQNGSYALKISDSLCIDTSSCFAVTTVGLTNVYSINNFKIYPNPTEGDIRFEFDSKNETSLKIYDMNGRMIREITQLNSGLYSNLVPKNGIYYFEIETNNLRKRFKVIKMK